MGSSPEVALTLTETSPVSGRENCSAGRSAWTSFMNLAHAGPAMVAPVSSVPSERLPSSKPYQIAVVIWGENPTVHASDQFCVVPVLPAIGRLRMSSRMPVTPARVPSRTVLCRMLVMM